MSNYEIEIYGLDNVREHISNFTYELLSQEKNSFRFYNVAYNLNDDKVFFIEDGKINCPYLIPKIEHEIAHILEMSDLSRICIPDWGMEAKKYNKKPSSMFCALAREIRVRNIHKILAGEDTNLRKCGGESNTLQEYAKDAVRGKECWLEMGRRFIPYGRFNNENDFHSWVINIAETTIKVWNVERIRHEWDIKLNIMREHLYSQKIAA